jgi:hypothetical protein
MKNRVPTAHKLFFARAVLEPGTLPELERLFFSNVILRNGTFKTTNHRRLDDLNALVNGLLPGVRPLRLMDVAVSSGVSTAEWLASLDARGVDYAMVAGDLTVDAYLISAGFGLRVLVDDMGYPLQYDIRGLAIRRDVNRRGMARRFFALLWLQFVSAVLRRALIRRSSRRSGSPPENLYGFSCLPVKLVSTELKPNEKLTIVKDDILTDAHFQNTFHVIRAANILNRVYFSDSTLSAMLRNLRSRLVPGGALVVCRTLDDGVNHATMFALKENGRLEVLARLNDGSEIEALILSLPPNKSGQIVA